MACNPASTQRLLFIRRVSSSFPAGPVLRTVRSPSDVVEFASLDPVGHCHWPTTGTVVPCPRPIHLGLGVITSLWAVLFGLQIGFRHHRTWTDQTGPVRFPPSPTRWRAARTIRGRSLSNCVSLCRTTPQVNLMCRFLSNRRSVPSHTRGEARRARVARPRVARYADVMPTKPKAGAPVSTRKTKSPARKRRAPPQRSATSKQADAGQQADAGEHSAVEVLPAIPRAELPAESRAELAFVPALADEVLAHVRDGVPLPVAARGSVPLHVVEHWLSEIPEFADAIAKAERAFVREATLALKSSGAGAWQRYAWLLERLHPQHFGTKPELKAQVTHKFEVSKGVCDQLSKAWTRFEQARTVKTLVEPSSAKARTA